MGVPQARWGLVQSPYPIYRMFDSARRALLTLTPTRGFGSLDFDVGRMPGNYILPVVWPYIWSPVDKVITVLGQVGR